MQDKIIGNFYFRRTNNGSLMGEYTNRSNEKVYTEAAIPTDKSQTFAGSYKTSWFEGNSEDPHIGDLVIEQINEHKFKLTWKNKNRDEFYGEGFIVDNILIGFYIEEEPKN
jgi:hypothetical protein